MRIVLADDAALLREGLAGLLTAAGYEVVAQVADAYALREKVEQLSAAGALPDVVVTDVRMPPTGTDDGLRAAIGLRAAHPGLPVIVLSAYVAGPYLRELLDGPDAAAGGVGYLLKERVGRVSDFTHSLDIVAAGGVVVDPEVLAQLMHADNAPPSADAGSGLTRVDRYERGAAAGTPGPGKQHAALARLTPREQEVLALMAEGLSNPQVAERLVLSDGAVAKHVANIFAKLDLPPDQSNRRVRAVLTWLRARA
ncbi:response regulator transcription factor [Actinomyces sp.]|uniref:response regulator n=1 Tax=Actinomyces sp. TaxID=29317 RepID=UPI0026DD6774|nr:response regulator transcription factor [Actinomyces sp.]MDO4901203.1 response regulator transcription factor [Actinomyces sp.]